MATKKLSQKYLTISNRPEKGGSFGRAGKKKRGYGGNEFLPARTFKLLNLHSVFLRAARGGGGRRGQELQDLPKFPWRLASILLLEISSNFVIQAAPNGKLRFFGRRRPRKTQLASHFLPHEPEVRLRGAQSSAQWYDNFTIAAEQPIFCISPKAKLLNFQKESDNFPCEARLCPKAITT